VPSNYVKKEKKSIFEKIIPRKSNTSNSKNNPSTSVANTAVSDSSMIANMAIVKHKYTAVK